MKHSELLVAISDLDPIDARGSFQRHCSLRWDGLRPSAAGGRWGERGAFEVQDRADEPWSPMRAERDLFFVGTSDLLRNRCRLACLSRAARNERSSLIGFGDGYARARMWAQYADNHAGVCLAFDQEHLREAAIAAACRRRWKTHPPLPVGDAARSYTPAGPAT